MSEIDPVEFGRMLSSVETLTQQLAITNSALRENTQSNAALEKRIVELEGRWSSGRGVLVGIIVGVGFAAKGVMETIKAWVL